MKIFKKIFRSLPPSQHKEAPCIGVGDAASEFAACQELLLSSDRDYNIAHFPQHDFCLFSSSGLE